MQNTIAWQRVVSSLRERSNELFAIPLTRFGGGNECGIVVRIYNANVRLDVGGC